MIFCQKWQLTGKEPHMGGYFFLSLRGGYIFLMAPLHWWVQTGSHRGTPFKALWSYLFGGPSLKDPDLLEKSSSPCMSLSTGPLPLHLPFYRLCSQTTCLNDLFFSCPSPELSTEERLFVFSLYNLMVSFAVPFLSLMTFSHDRNFA